MSLSRLSLSRLPLSRLRAAAVLAIVSGGLLLTGCGDDDSPGGPVSAAQIAIGTAEAERDGIAIELDYDESGEWKIDVVAGDESAEVTVSADGDEVLSVGTAEPLDADDQAEFGESQVSLYEALKIATGQVPGTIQEAGLTTRDGVVVWEVDVRADDSGDSTTVFVDAETSDVVD